MARRTNDAPIRESRSRMRTPSARRPSPVLALHTLHPSVVKELGSHRAKEIAPPGNLCAGGAMSSPFGSRTAVYDPRFTLHTRHSSILRPALAKPRSSARLPARPPGSPAPGYTPPLAVAGATARSPAACRRPSRNGLDERDFTGTVHSSRHGIIKSRKTKRAASRWS
jgi:hypothetical protein